MEAKEVQRVRNFSMKDDNIRGTPLWIAEDEDHKKQDVFIHSEPAEPTLTILFLCTVHNSLSQRLFLTLKSLHHVTIEYALSDEHMITAANMVKPDLIICPFLTAKVPKEVYENYMTLIIHPGPPGDEGPSSLDWLLIGDEGRAEASSEELKLCLNRTSSRGRSFWAVSIIQAIEKFDAGPVWAFEQFPIDIDNPGLTKSKLYRGKVTRAAVNCIVLAIKRVLSATNEQKQSPKKIPSAPKIHPGLKVDDEYRQICISTQEPFLGGTTLYRPLLSARARGIHPFGNSAETISRFLRSANSQPGILSNLSGQSLFLYGGIIEAKPGQRGSANWQGLIFPKEAYVLVNVLGVRHGAICMEASCGKGIWITHIRRPKRAKDLLLWPKLPAVKVLLQLGLLQPDKLKIMDWPIAYDEKTYSTFQEISISYILFAGKATAHLKFNFYNGAMSTSQCRRLNKALQEILSQHSKTVPICALVLHGGEYFSNGIALNTIEAAENPADEAWANMNALNDVVFSVLYTFPNAVPPIYTIAAMHGNAAAGGVALAIACDAVMAGNNVVLNPSYKSMGLYGSEYHTITYEARDCLLQDHEASLKDMVPISVADAYNRGIVNEIVPGFGQELEDNFLKAIELVVSGAGKQGYVEWKAFADLSIERLNKARAHELGEMAKDFWSARSERFEQKRRNFVCKVAPNKTPVRFAKHRRTWKHNESGKWCQDNRGLKEEENSEHWDSVEWWEKNRRETLKEEVKEEVKEQLKEEVKEEVKQEVREELREEVEAQIRREILEEMRIEVENKIERERITKALEQAYKTPVKGKRSQGSTGQPSPHQGTPPASKNTSSPSDIGGNEVSDSKKPGSAPRNEERGEGSGTGSQNPRPKTVFDCYYNPDDEGGWI